MTALLSLRGISKTFGNLPVLRDIALEIAEGEFLTILGESGSGKTTLLRIISGFERPNAGEVWMGGKRIDTEPPNKRDVNTVFQHYALFPRLCVFENVAYGLRARSVPQLEIQSRVDRALAQVNMSTFRNRRPSALSGGQQQRVALARALVNRPRVLLLDEPLSALDANLRRQMQSELKTLQREVGITFTFVTHDQEEAMTLSDRIALLRSGQLEQVSTPHDLYNHPQTEYAATFVGQTNLLRDGSRLLSLRPEQIRIISPEATPTANAVRIKGMLRHQTFNGPTDLLEIECENGLKLTVRAPNQLSRPRDLWLEWTPEAAVPVEPSCTRERTADS